MNCSCLNVSINLNCSCDGNNNDTADDVSSLEGATIVSPIAMFIAGMVGNILALLVIHRTRVESQRLMFHTLVAALVWNDLIGIVLTSPITIIAYLQNFKFPGGAYLCEFNGLVMLCFGISTPLIVGAMAVERFLFVKHTFFYAKHCAPKTARLIIVVIWTFVILFGLLPLTDSFGEYTLQHPGTWCYFNYHTSDPRHAAYGFMYSGLILLLVIVMGVCNLVVVVTLIKFRKFRKRHSSASLQLHGINMDGQHIDETARQQACMKRRTQRDIRFQMIVVVCAITAVFTICWVPLMVHIQKTLILGVSGEEDQKRSRFFGLLAIRLASINQTLNPWLYVILRRTLIIRVKKMCCRWKRLFRRRKSPNNRQVPTMPPRRRQFVHVRNQLCHRNQYVGDEAHSSEVLDSIRHSLQQGCLGARSLPDVMMHVTGRKGDQLSLPDITKPHSYGGRISHTNDCEMYIQRTCHGTGSCDCSCYSPQAFIVSECSECMRERELQRRRQLCQIEPAALQTGLQDHVCPDCFLLSSPTEDFQHGAYTIKVEKVASQDAVAPNSTFEHGNSPYEGDMSDPLLDKCASDYDHSHCRHSDNANLSSLRESSKGTKSSSRSSSTKRSGIFGLLPFNKSSKPPRSKNFENSKEFKGRNAHTASLKSSTTDPSCKAKQQLRQTNSLDIPAQHNGLTPDLSAKRVNSHNGQVYFTKDTSASVNKNDNNDLHNEASISDEEKSELLDRKRKGARQKDPITITDDYGFSSMPSAPTETFVLSDTRTNAALPSQQPSTGWWNSSRGKSFFSRLSGKEKPSTNKGSPSAGPHVTQSQQQDKNLSNSDSDKKVLSRVRFYSDNTAKDPEDVPSTSPPPSSPLSESRRQSEGSSGIFSDESPTNNKPYKNQETVASGLDYKKEAVSEAAPAEIKNKKPPVRKVNSLH